MKATIELPTVRCEQCGYEWVPRRALVGRRCPKCSTRRWAGERRESGKGARKAS